jgi:hypothetical protein
MQLLSSRVWALLRSGLTLFLSLSCLLVPHSALAAKVTWELRGLVLLNRGFSAWPLQAGNEVRVHVTFDTAASFFARPSSGGRPGFRYEYSNVPSLQFEIWGGGCSPCKPVTDVVYNRIYVRDSFADPQYNSGSDLAMDGITFQINPTAENGNATIGVYFRDTASKFSPEIIANPGSQPLPATPDSRLAQMTTRHLQLVEGDNLLNIEIDSVRVKPAAVTNTLGSSTLTIPTVRVGASTYQNVVLQLINPTQMIFRLASATLMNPPAAATAWYDPASGLVNLTQLSYGSQTYSSVTMSLSNPASMEFTMTSGALATPGTPTNQVRLRGQVLLSRGVVSQGDVSVRCASGDTAVFALSYNGRFDDMLASQQASPFPCMVRVNSTAPAVSLYGYVTGPDMDMSISPLSSLVLTKALRANPAATFAAFGQTVKSLDAAALSDAPQFVIAALEAFSGYRMIRYSGSSRPNVFVTPSSDDLIDRRLLLKSVDVVLTAAASNYAALHTLVAQEAALRESFDRKIYDAVTALIKPEVTGVNCTVTSSQSLSCKVTGKNLSYPGFIDGGVSDIGITVARASQALTKTDQNMPFKPSWCSRAAMEIGTLFVSTDGNALDGPDPLEVIAEEIQFPPCGPTLNFSDNLWVEVTKNNLDAQGPAGWPLLRKPHTVVEVSGTSGTGGGSSGGSGGNTSGGSGANSISITSATCTSIATDLNDTDGKLITSAPVIRLTGTFTKQSQYVLEAVAAKVSPSDALLVNALTNYADTADGVFLLHPVCNSLPGSGCILDSSGTYGVEPDTSVPGWEALQLWQGWPELGISRTSAASVQVHIFIHDFTKVAARQSVTVSCPATKL